MWRRCRRSIADGRVRPAIDRRYPLDEVVAALRHVDDGARPRQGPASSRRHGRPSAPRRHRRGLGAHPRGPRAADRGVGRDGRRQGRRRRRRSSRRSRSTEPDVSVVDVRMPPSQRDEGLRAAIEARRRVPGHARSSSSASTSSGSTRPSCSPTAPAASATCSRTGSATSRSSWTRSGASPAAGPRWTRRSSPSSWSATAPTTRSRRSRRASARSSRRWPRAGRTSGIARLLTITEGATEKHISNIFGKLELPDSPGRPPPRAGGPGLPRVLGRRRRSHRDLGADERRAARRARDRERAVDARDAARQTGQPAARTRRCAPPAPSSQTSTTSRSPSRRDADLAARARRCAWRRWRAPRLTTK